VSSSRYTPAQLRGVTDTTDAAESGPGHGGGEDPGEWSEDLEVAIYGEQEWLLPGMGEGAPDCATWYPEEFCDEAGHVQLGQHLCGRRDCPRCWNSQWARPRTVSVVQRLAAARHIEEKGLARRTVHAAVSPAEGSVQSIEDFYSAKSEAVDIAKEHGIRGGLVVPHGYRVDEEHKRIFRAKVEAGKWDPEEDGGIWRWVRENRKDWRDQVKWSPHFHVVGLARDVEGRERADGWVVENIKRGDSHGLDPFESLHDEAGYEDMVRVVRYLLSHATFTKEGNRQVVTWFGSVHGTNFDPEEELSEGAWRAIQRHVEEIVGGAADRSDGEGGGGEEEAETCPVEECEGEMHPIWEAGEFLQQRRDDLPRENEHRLAKAYEWAVGDIQPPPGLKKPRTEEQAEEALEALL
jgi:hypothetical protein